MMCRVLNISRSSYYRWKNNPVSKRECRKNILHKEIRSLYFEFHGRYGSPRLSKELEHRGVKLSRLTVGRYMRQMGLRSKFSRKYKVTTDSDHKEPVAENLLNREFYSYNPGEKCVSDITYISTKEGFLYLTTIIDLFDRKVIGWHISGSLRAKDTVIAALNKAVNNRYLKNDMIFHSDRGIQYACKRTVNYLKSYKFKQSMSRKGNCWDNAVAESFFKSLKAELIYGQKLSGRDEMKLKIFEYIEIYYNKNRRHSYLGNQTIDEFWRNYKTENHFINNVA